MSLTPSEIARETLKRLAQQRRPPTPDNYRTLYHEIAGTTAVDAFPETTFKSMLSGLPRNTPEKSRFARQLDTAVGDKNWDSLKKVLAELLNKVGAEPPNWAGLIRELLTRLSARQADLTPARKREALDHVLSSSGSPELLHGRLQGLLKNWAQGVPLDGTEHDEETAVPPAPTTSATEQAGSSGGAGELLDLLAQLIEATGSILLQDNRALADEAARLSEAARKVNGSDALVHFVADMKRFSYRLNFAVEDQNELKAGLLRLLHLVIDNINQLVIDDQWLQGQIAVVLDLVGQPLNLRRLDDAERRIKDVIYKQSALKKSLLEAQDQIRQMLATFVDRLVDFSESTGEFHDKIGRCAERISRASDIGELTEVLTQVMHETRMIQINTLRSRDELNEMRDKVAMAEREIERLQGELSSASEMVRIDALTGALNRKGMEEALDIEVARARRHDGGLCTALLDIDNFKKLNDALGHAGGDEALIHLAKVVQESIRPADTLCRYGGEEFVVLLPDTPIDDAVSVMTRVQRELTRRFFLHNNEKILITFSCGVAELGESESAMDAVVRADGAMYLAKRAGKNRVLAA